jgi:hypothetical protein
MNLHRCAAEAKQPLAAAPHFLARSLFRRLPARLSNLPADARDVLGTALDRGLARLVLGDDGDALVVRGRAVR